MLDFFFAKIIFVVSFCLFNFLTDTSFNGIDFSSVLIILFSGINLTQIQFIFMSIIICCTQKFNSPSKKNYLSLLFFNFLFFLNSGFFLCMSPDFIFYFYWTTILLFFMRVGIEANCGGGEKALKNHLFFIDINY